jgi:Trk K+ transport system NAD-binding subunit
MTNTRRQRGTVAPSTVERPAPGREAEDPRAVGGEAGPPRRTVVFGGRDRGREFARRFVGSGPVRYVESGRSTSRAGEEEFETVVVDGFDDATGVAAAEVTGDDRVVVATDCDSTNLLLTQVLRTAYGVRRPTVLVNRPVNRAVFDQLDARVVCVADVVADALVDHDGGVVVSVESEAPTGAPEQG